MILIFPGLEPFAHLSYLLVHSGFVFHRWWDVWKWNRLCLVIFFTGSARHESSEVVVPGPEFHSIENCNEFSEPNSANVIGVLMNG